MGRPRHRVAHASPFAALLAAGLLVPIKRSLLHLLKLAEQREVRSHLAEMIARLPLTKGERARAVAALWRYLYDTDPQVRVSALQALADLAVSDRPLEMRVEAMARDLLRNDAPSLSARSRKALARIAWLPRPLQLRRTGRR